MAYIEREKAIDEIDKWLDSVGYVTVGKGLTSYGELIGCLEDTPAADVVEVVRCKDCAIPHNKWLGCPKMNGLIPPPNHFCSYGERKECADQKPVTNFEYFKKNIAKMSIDELAKVIKDSDNCEKFCVFTKDGRCDSRGNADVCEIGVKRYLESEVSE